MERPSWFLNEWYWREVCGQIVKCADDVLSDRTGIIAASQILHRLAHEVRAAEDPDFQLFTVVYSESDALPVGSERKYWSAASLEREDSKIAALEERYRDAALQAARRLRDKYALV